MADESARDAGREIWRWVILAALLLACLASYFLFAPRVPPVITPAQNAETS